MCVCVYICVQGQACVGEKQTFTIRTQSGSFIPSSLLVHVGKLRPREEKAFAQPRLHPALAGVRKRAQSLASLQPGLREEAQNFPGIV